MNLENVYQIKKFAGMESMIGAIIDELFELPRCWRLKKFAWKRRFLRVNFRELTS